MENLKNITPVEDFNWDAYENGEAVTSMSHEDLEKAYDGTLNKVNDREVVDGTVIAMNKREVVVNIGYKSDGIIPLNEFRYNPDLKIGDTVEVYIENQEDKKGQLILSHKKARATRSWDRVNAALENEEIIKGYIKCRTKGGMIVDVFGIEAFLPGSQIDVKPIRDYDVFVGKTMEFKVVKINQEFKNVVVSHKALIEAELEQQKKEIIVDAYGEVERAMGVGVLDGADRLGRCGGDARPGDRPGDRHLVGVDVPALGAVLCALGLHGQQVVDARDGDVDDEAHWSAPSRAACTSSTADFHPHVTGSSPSWRSQRG
jgi:DNA-directed RNA polymerase subunit E'/Rpb7